MAQLFVSDDEAGFLKARYLLELWRAILEHAPKMVQALEARCPKRYDRATYREIRAGIADWRKDYGLPVEFEEYAEEYIRARDRFQRIKEQAEAAGLLSEFEDCPEEWLGPEWLGGKYSPISPLVWPTGNSKRPRHLPVTRFLEELYDPMALSYNPSRSTRNQWLKWMLCQLDNYCDTVEGFYKEAGWQANTVKYRWEHFSWLAQKLEGLSYKEIAEGCEDTCGFTDRDTIRRAVKRLSALLGVSPPPAKH